MSKNILIDIEKLKDIKKNFDEIKKLMSNSENISNKKKYKILCKQYKELEKIVVRYNDFLKYKKIIIDADDMLLSEKDIEMRNIIQYEKDESLKKLFSLEKEIHILLTPIDPNDNKNAILEIRAGTGGNEACLFVEDIMRMYLMYFKEMNWNFDIMNMQSGGNGYKEVIINVNGEEVYGTLKFESGVHRVQRIPKTESQGRLHTSAITVAVLPEADEIDIEINSNEIKRYTFRASGAGGQHVNKTESAIRLIHIPTGISVECQEERSQHKNFDKAMKVLRSRVYQIKQDRFLKKISNYRKSLVSTGDRSAKIRTYNYPQGRVTDHRINKSIYSLEEFLNGKIHDMIDALKITENAEKLKQKPI